MSNFKCKECGKEFDNKRSFHLHLKAHSLALGDYYVKHYQKKDLYTGDLLQFKNYDLYFNNDFNHFDNFVNWLRVEPKAKTKEYVLEKAKKKFEDKGVKYSPPNLFYDLSFMANINTYKRLWGSYDNFIKEVGLEQPPFSPSPISTTTSSGVPRKKQIPSSHSGSSHRNLCCKAIIDTRSG